MQRPLVDRLEFESDSSAHPSPSYSPVERELPPSSSTSSAPTVIIPPHDPFDMWRSPTIMAAFYDELLSSGTYWVHIAVKFWKPVRGDLYLCFTCANKFLAYSLLYEYEDFVSFYTECFKDVFFCSMCMGKLYRVITCLFVLFK